MYGHKLLCGLTVNTNFGLADLEAFNVPGTLIVSFKPLLLIPVTPTAGRIPSSHAQEASNMVLFGMISNSEKQQLMISSYNLEVSPLSHSEPSPGTLPYHQSFLILWLEFFNVSVTQFFF